MRLRHRDRGVALMVIAFMTAASLALSAPARHEACASPNHHCDRPTEILTCCCSHDSSTASVNGMLLGRFDTLSKASAGPMPPHSGAGASPPVAPAGVRTAPLRDRPPDLPTLLSDLRL